MPDQTTAPASTEKSTQARLLQKRNADLQKRFHELYTKKRIRHDDVLVQLSEEFYITPRTIRGILKDMPDTPAHVEPGEQLTMPL